VLRAEGLVKTYRGPGGTPVRALAGVQLKVAPGELVAVVGPSGAGKSTLLNLLGLLEPPDTGEVWYGEHRVSAWPRGAQSRARGRWVGFVFQTFMLLPSLTALDNVLLPARYHGGITAAVRARAQELLDAFGILDRQHHYPAELSGGEQQRVAFCRAVLLDPPILLADEPTGNLDEAHARVMIDALRARARAGGAVVVVTHRLELAREAHVVYRLEGGRLV
jgi:ABC-type lipoprotein export system ATPase subunit